MSGQVSAAIAASEAVTSLSSVRYGRPATSWLTQRTAAQHGRSAAVASATVAQSSSDTEASSGTKASSGSVTLLTLDRRRPAGQHGCARPNPSVRLLLPRRWGITHRANEKGAEWATWRPSGP